MQYRLFSSTLQNALGILVISNFVEACNTTAGWDNCKEQLKVMVKSMPSPTPAPPPPFQQPIYISIMFPAHIFCDCLYLDFHKMLYSPVQL